LRRGVRRTRRLLFSFLPFFCFDSCQCLLNFFKYRRLGVSFLSPLVNEEQKRNHVEPNDRFQPDICPLTFWFVARLLSSLCWAVHHQIEREWRVQNNRFWVGLYFVRV
jgi:hypothetical protein